MGRAAVIPVPLWSRRFPVPHPVLVGVAGFGALGLGSTVDPSALQTIAATIQRVEGYYPGTPAYLNNNPGNLAYVGQAGAVLGVGGFARFPSYQDGLNALYGQIQLYADRGMSISDMMRTYAPASVPGNNPDAYAAQVAGALGVSPDVALSDLGMVSSSDYLGTPAELVPAGFDFSSVPPALWAAVAVGVAALVLS